MKSILILDDDYDLTEILKTTLDYLGVSLCKIIHSYQELIELPIDLASFNVALIDINLGVGQPDGIDAYKYLRISNYPGEIIFFTGHGHADTRIQAILNCSATRLLEKPVSIEVLTSILR